MNIPLMAPPTTRAIHETLHDLAFLDEETTGPVRPIGGWRTKRCDHGLRCDPEEWLCESCEPRTDGERAAKGRLLETFPRWNGKVNKVRSGEEFTDCLVAVLRAGNVSDLNQVAIAMTATLGRHCRPGNVALCLRRLRKNGRVVGWKVVE